MPYGNRTLSGSCESGDKVNVIPGKLTLEFVGYCRSQCPFQSIHFKETRIIVNCDDIVDVIQLKRINANIGPDTIWNFMEF